MEPQDLEIEKSIGKTDRVIMRGGSALPAEASTYIEDRIDTYEENHGVPYTAAKLSLENTDHVTDAKIRAIDEYIRMEMLENGFLNTPKGYNAIFDRMAKSLGETIEGAKNSNTMHKVIDNLFMQVSLANRMPSKTYLPVMLKKFSEQRVSKLSKQLQDALLNSK